MSKARITYRFDRDREPAESPPGKVIPLYQEDVWKSPIDEETERIERLIRGAETQSQSRNRPEIDSEKSKPLYYTAEDADATFGRIPFYEEPAVPMYRRTKKRANWVGMTMSVAGAVLTGVVLGMFVLSLFRGEPASLFTANSDSAQNNSVNGTEVGADASDPAEEQLPIISADQAALPEQTYYFVQNGVFSTAEGAELAASELRDRGLAGVVESGEKLSVFAGAAIDRNDALLISNHLQEEGLEVYYKPYVLPAADHIDWSSGDAGIVAEYLKLSRDIAEQLISISLQHLGDATPIAISKEQVQQLKNMHQQWTTKANAVLADAPEASKPIVQEMNTDINSAIVSIEQYQKKPSEAYMWQVQTAVTEHLIGQKSLLEG